MRGGVIAGFAEFYPVRILGLLTLVQKYHVYFNVNRELIHKKWLLKKKLNYQNGQNLVVVY
jgi:hypothetical protein